MKKLAKIIRISAKESFKNLRNGWPIFCKELKREIYITRVFFDHINWRSKEREIKEIILRLSTISLIQKILIKWKIREIRESEKFKYYWIKYKTEWEIFNLILSKKINWWKTILLSSFIENKKSSSQDLFPRQPQRVQSFIWNHNKNKNNIVNLKQIKKAIIPIAGLGSRFLPITKSVWKEMLNIIDKPVIHYIFEECVNSWIEEFIFVIWENQKLVKDYFDLNSEYCKKIYSSWNKEKISKLDELKNLLDWIKINFTIQKNPKWDWDAILRAENFFKEWENFAILFWDDLVQNKKNPWIWQLIKKFSELEKNFPDEKKFIIWIQKIFWEEIKNYWVIDKNSPIQKIQEKPEFKDAISDLWIIWKYICNYSIFKAIKNWNKSDDWEIRLSNWFEEILKSPKNKIFWEIIKWERYDTWSKIWFIKATIWFWIENWIVEKKEILDFIKKF